MSSSHRVTIARSAAEVERLRPLWDTVPWPNVEADLDFFLTVTATAEDGARPHVIAIERPERPPLVAVARLESRTLETRVGYRVIHRPHVRALSVVYAGAAGVETEADARELLQELTGALRGGEADVLTFTKLRTDGPLYSVVSREPSPACRDHLPVVVPRTEVAVPDDFAAFLQARSRNTRENVKRYGRKLEKAFPDRVRVKRYRDVADVEEASRMFEGIAADTYQRALDAGFRDDERGRALMSLAARRGWFRGWTLSIDDQPVAFWYGLAYASTFFIGSPGYNPDFADHRVGQYLQMRMMEDLCADPTVERLDYGFGDAQYKRSFGDNRWEEADVMVFAPRARPIGINATRTAVVAGTRAARRALGEERVAALKKRARRARAAPA
jgi:CelD/BcsL family acetyltransferase involved in cellulose biosynthesis